MDKADVLKANTQLKSLAWTHTPNKLHTVLKILRLDNLNNLSILPTIINLSQDGELCALTQNSNKKPQNMCSKAIVMQSMESLKGHDKGQRMKLLNYLNGSYVIMN